MPSERSPIRVVINGIHSKSGGGVTYLNNILPHLAQDPGLELHLVLHESQLPQYEFLVESARLHLFRFKPSMAATLLWEQTVLPIIARMMGADVVFSPANYGPVMAHHGVVLIRNSLAVATQDLRFGKMIYWFGMGIMTLLSLATARKAIAVSSYAVGATTAGPFRSLQRKITIVHHGISPLFRPGGARDGNTVLAVGDIYVQKNYHTLLKAFRHLLDDHPDLVLLIAGRPLDADYMATLTAGVAEMKLEGNIRFLGHVQLEDLIALYQSCTLFVFPSTVETFGNPLVEAMACGAPIACSRRAAMPEIAGDAAEYFAPEDAAAMCATMSRLLNDVRHCQDLSARAVARAAQFSWNHCAGRLADVLKQAAC